MSNFNSVIERKNTNSFKWDGAELIKEIGITERFDDDTLPLFVADMDFEAAKPIVAALQKVVDQKVFGYSIVPDAYYEAIQSWFSKKYGWRIKRGQIVYSPGTVFAINTCVKAFTEKGEGVIIQRPSYPPFKSAIESNNRELVSNELIWGEDSLYKIDFVDLEEKAKDPNNKALIFCNPHNPTGRVFNAEELARIVALCEKYDLYLIADEIHGDLIRKNVQFIPLATMTNYKKLVTLTAINKTFNVAGLHCTNVIIDDEEIRQKFIDEQGNHQPSAFTVAALIAAYNEGEQWLRELNEYIDETFEWVSEFLREKMPQVKFTIPEGTYVLWMDFSGYGLNPEEVHDRIYNKANVVLEDGLMFCDNSAHFQRICLPSPRGMVKEAFERIAKQF